MSFYVSGSYSEDLARFRTAFVAVILLILASCTSTGIQEGEMAGQQSTSAAAEQQAMTAEALEAQRLADLRKREKAKAAEEAKLQARRDRVRARREEAAKAKAEEERVIAAQAAKVQEEQRIRQAQEQELAVAEAERQAKLARISELEAQIRGSESSSGDDEARVTVLNEAVSVAEELLDALADEQLKYENTDDSGNTVEPLAKDVLEQLESRKNELVGRVGSQ
ncbi:MAG: hypothetical protein AB8B95_13485 [Pseudohongiellaceae bacterium]